MGIMIPKITAQYGYDPEIRRNGIVHAWSKNGLARCHNAAIQPYNVDLTGE